MINCVCYICHKSSKFETYFIYVDRKHNQLEYVCLTCIVNRCDEQFKNLKRVLDESKP